MVIAGNRENLGKVVTCIRLSCPGERVPSSLGPIELLDTEGEVWIVDRDIVCRTTRTRRRILAKAILDRLLMPIRPPEQDDAATARLTDAFLV